jgi:hypothetical protein
MDIGQLNNDRGVVHINESNTNNSKKTIHPSSIPKNALDDTRSKTIINKGQIIVEVYDEDGRLVRKNPPGYLPLDEVA